MENRYEVSTFVVNYRCECGHFAVEASGMVLPGDPPQYPHKCPKCDREYFLPKRYPVVEYSEKKFW